MKCKSLQPVVILILFYMGLYFLCNVNRSSGNHGFSYHASTPIMVPSAFAWWLPIALGLLFCGVYIAIRKILGWSRRYAAFIAFLWVFTIPVLSSANMLYTEFFRPDVTIHKSQIYWGWTFVKIGHVFLWQNIIVFLVYISFPLTLFYLYRFRKYADRGSQKQSSPFWMLSFCIAYAIALIPFITSHAWVHGYAGSYVDNSCQRQLQSIHLALLRYAADHDECLPIADSYETLLPQIEPYFDEKTDSGQFDACLIGKAMDRFPKTFEWNANLSGKKVVINRNAHNENFMIPPEKRDAEYPYPTIFPFGGDSFDVAGRYWVDCPYAMQRRTKHYRMNMFFDISGKDFDVKKFEN